MRKLIFIISILTLGNCLAESGWDYSSRGLIRSFPLGASISGTLGHSTKFWGGGNKLFYGFIRPSITAQTSGKVNYGKAQLDIFPISFAGAYAGYSLGSRSLEELDTFDCTQIICDEGLKRPYYGVRFAFKLGRFFLFSDNKKEEIEIDGRAGLFAEESSSLVGRSGSDVLTTNLATFGFEFSKAWEAGAFYSRSSMKHVRNDSSMALGFVRMKRKPWKFMLGAGNFHTRTDQNNFTVLGVIDWVGSKGFLLF